MAWYVLAGRNVGFRIGRWASNFYQNVPVIKDVLQGLQPGAVPTGVTLLTPQCYLNEVGLDIDAGITPIVAIGVENIASLEEFIVRAQNIRTRFTVQSTNGTSHPISFIHNLIEGATRLGGLYHLPPYFLDFYVVDTAVGTPGILGGYRVCAPFAFVRNLRWTQRPDDAAQVEITWFVPYVSFDTFSGSITLVQYLVDAGIFIAREGVLQVTASGSDVIDLTALSQDRIVTDLTIELNNDLREVYTFSLAGDITTEAIRRLLRVFNAIFEGRSTVSGSFTMIYPALLGSLNLAQPQAFKTLTFTYYEAAGSGYSQNPVPVYKVEIVDAKVLSARVNFATEQMVSLSCNFQGLDFNAQLLISS